MQALHNDDDRAVRFIEAGRNRLLIPGDDVLAHNGGCSFARLVRVVDDDGAAERFPHLRRAVARDGAIRAGRIDDAALRRAKLILCLAVVLQRRPREDGSIFLALHHRPHFVSVGRREPLGIAGVNELGVGIKPHRPRHEALNRDFGFARTRRDVDDEAVSLSDNDALQRFADFALVPVLKHVCSATGAKHILCERVKPRQ